MSFRILAASMRRCRSPTTTSISACACDKAEWRLIWTPTVELYHRESASVGRHDAPERRDGIQGGGGVDARALGACRWMPTRSTIRICRLRTAYHLAFPPRRSAQSVNRRSQREHPRPRTTHRACATTVQKSIAVAVARIRWPAAAGRHADRPAANLRGSKFPAFSSAVARSDIATWAFQASTARNQAP